MLKHSVRMLLIAAAVAFWSPALLAQKAPDASPDRIAAARELMTVAGSIRQFDQFMPAISAQLTKTFIALAPHAEAQIREVMAEVVKRMSDRKLVLIDQVAALYAKELTLEELNALTAFYKSPVGAKFVSIQPVILQQTMAIGQKWGSEIGREIDQEMRRELQKRGIKI